MEDISYPLNRPLSVAQMIKRIQDYNTILHAVRFYKAPQEKRSIHLLVKDNIGVQDWPASAGSFALKDMQLPDAFCIKQLRKNDRIDIFGKTHLTELAGFVTASVLKKGYSELGGFGRNPHGRELPCGGSSVGSAVAVSAGFCDAALGTETRGSIMIPALYNGVYGFKPTRGSVSRTGIIPLSSSFDAPGVLARSPELLEEIFLSMTGFDPEDSQSFDFRQTPIHLTRKNPRLICLTGLTGRGTVSSSVLKSYLRRLEDLGLSVVCKNLPKVEFDYKTISSADINRDITKFLKRFGTASEPSSFHDLVDFYRSRPESHRYGMERLTDAVNMKKIKLTKLTALVKSNTERANTLIDGLLNAYDSDFILTPGYIDWWAIGGGPTAALPISLKKGKPECVMIGGRRNGDLSLLHLLKRISLSI